MTRQMAAPQVCRPPYSVSIGGHNRRLRNPKHAVSRVRAHRGVLCFGSARAREPGRSDRNLCYRI